jgi:hypothetical protein
MTRCDACRKLVPVVIFTGEAYLCPTCERARKALKGADLERQR